MKHYALCLMMAILLVGCATSGIVDGQAIEVPYLPSQVTVDGELNEECYRNCIPFTAFLVAGDNTKEAMATKAWLFWNETCLACAFECVDTTPAWAPPSDNERDVDGQDRVELFLWTGDPEGDYFCIEMAPAGAIHDYKAQFYRNFDDTWHPGDGWAVKSRLTSQGYTVEMCLPKTVFEETGVKLQSGCHFRMGLFRADYDKLNGEPTWIAWIDHGGEPDFHLAESFGIGVLAK